MKRILVLIVLMVSFGVFSIASGAPNAISVSDNNTPLYWGAADNGQAPADDYEIPENNITNPEPGTILQGGDGIADAYVITSLPFNDTGSTAGYASDWDPQCCDGCMYGPDVVYQFIPDHDMKIDVNTCGGDFYDVLYIYENTDDNLFACNSWYDVCPPHSGFDRLELTEGNIYYFVVDGYWTSQGYYEIHMQEHVAIECPEYGIQENETSCGDGYVDTFNGGCNNPDDLHFSAIAPGDYICGTSGTFVLDELNYRDTDWYRYELTEPKMLHWYIVAEFPVQGYIFDAVDENCDNIGSVTQGQAASYDTVHIAHNALPGVYYFYVSPVSFAGYDCPLTYSAWLTAEDPDPVPENDNCENVTAEQLTPAAPLTFTGTTVGATTQCYELELIPEVWAVFSQDVMANIKLEYCGTDPYFGGAYIVFANDCPCSELVYCNTYNYYECGDNNITFTWENLPAGTYYYPIMSKWGSSYGPYQITVSSTSTYAGIAVDQTEIIGETEPGAVVTSQLNISNIGYGQLDLVLQAVPDDSSIVWLSADIDTVSIPVGDPAVVATLTMDANSLVEGSYTGNIIITSNAPDNPEIIIPVTLTVGTMGYEYLIGDANMINGQWPPSVIGGDVTYLVNYFRGLNQACLLSGFYIAADANGDCNVIGSDVTKLVNYFRGLTALSNCAGYPSVWTTQDDLPEEAPEGWPNCEQ